VNTQSFDDQGSRRSHPDPVDVYVGKRLRKQRLLMRLSQEQLARAVGVTFQQIQKYERGTNRISASRLFDIAKVMGVPINFFFEHIDAEIEGRDGPGMLGEGPALPPTPPDALVNTVLESLPPQVRHLLTHNDTIDLITSYWRLPSDDIRRKSLTLLRSMSGLKEKKGEPIPDED